MKHVRLVIAASALALTTAAVAQDRDFSKVEIKATKLGGNVTLLEGAGGNIAVSAGPDGVLMVDDQFAPLAPKIEKAIAPLSQKPLRFVLNTHWHPDHTGGNESFGKSATIIAHKNVRVRLEQGMNAGGRNVPPAAPGALPVVTFEDGLSIHFNGEEIRVIHLENPAHTDGDAIVIFTGSKVAHLGDQFFNGNFPFIDLNSGGSVKGLIANLETIRAQLTPDMKLIPGHGPVATVADLDKSIAALKDVTARVEAGIKAGKTKEQLKAEAFKGYEKWFTSFVTPDLTINTLYTDLGGKK